MQRAWLLVLFIGLVDAAWILAGGWSVPYGDWLWSRLPWIALLVPLAFERYRSDLKLSSTLLATALLVAFSELGSALSYLVLSVGSPLADAAYARWDAALGFDWHSAVAWVHARPLLQFVLQQAYESGLIQVALVVLYLGFTARIEQLHEWIWLYMIGCLLAIATSLVAPAAGPWIMAPSAFNAAVLSDFMPLHSGTVHTLNLVHLQGLISMPSVHAMMGVFFVYAMRGTGLVQGLFVVLNVLMLAATPTEGGHYLVDVVAGILCALALIAASRWLRQRSPVRP